MNQNILHATVGLIVLIILLLIRKSALGAWYYHVQFVRALLGDSTIDTACEVLRTVKDPWEELGHKGWYRLQGCLGSDAGFERQGEVMDVIHESVKYLFGFTAILGPVATFFALGVAGWYVVTYGPRDLERAIATIRSIPQEIWIRIGGGVAVLSAIAVWLYVPLNAFLKSAIPLAVITFVLTAFHIITDTRGILVIIRPVLEFLTFALAKAPPLAENLYKPAQHVLTSMYYIRTCHHISNCECLTPEVNNDLSQQLLNARDALMLERHDNASLREAIERKEQEISLLENQQRSPVRRRTNYVGQRRSTQLPTPSPGSQPLPPSPRSPISPKTRDQQRAIEEYQDVIIQLQREAEKQARNSERQILNLKAQLEYAKGDGNVLQIKEEVDRLRAALRNKEKELNLANHQAMQARLELDKERNTSGSRACKNDAACQLLIQRLTREKEVLLERHAANDLMVQQAAREFGKSEEESRHYTVRSYLQELTQAMVQQIAAGGLGIVRNQPVFSNILSNMDKIRLRELEMYKNRLEDEVERLGGNMQFVKMGLNIRLPPRKLLHYKDLAVAVFDVYLNLCKTIRIFTDVFLKDLGLYRVMPWDHPRPRDDMINQRFYFHVQDISDQQFKISKNMKYEQYERLIYSLLQQEVGRLFSRLMDLKMDAVENSKNALSPMSIQLLEGKQHDIKHTIKSAVHFLSDDREIEKSTIPLSEPLNGTRAEIRYKIWKAMQEAITHLQNAILTFNTDVPPWRTPKDIGVPSFSPTKTFPDLVSRVLKFEVNTLDDRIDQLLQFMEAVQLPGTSRGQPRLAGPPRYQADFDGLRDAVVYAELCRGHWYDECYPEAPKVARLPLDHPPLLHAVRRETGDVLVPSVNPFPWKLQIGNTLQDVRITNPNSDSNALSRQILLESGTQTVVYKLPVAENSEIELKLDAQGNLIFGDFATEKRWYEKHYDRRKQLLAFIAASGTPLPYAMPTWNHGAGGPNFGLVKAKKRELAESVRDLTVWMVTHGMSLPDWPYKGGRMMPDDSMDM